ncbi:MFS transporter [Weissella confusa]|uniref:MFS transporter n=1 Tax=Weissella confusa TaxID=1583 RepID=A0A923NE90_WEICO|nr:MFS transporter [Weissella confusa]
MHKRSYINAATGFDGTKKIQSAGALMGLQWSMIWLPIIMAVLAILVIMKYPLTDEEVNKMNHEVEARHKKHNIAMGYAGRFFQQWGLTSATGFMWSLVPEVVTYGEYTSGKRVAGIINAIMGLFFKIGLALGGIIPPFFLQYNIGHSEWNGSISLIGSIPGIFLVFLWPKIRAKVGKK